MIQNNSNYYDDKYFQWQKNIGVFGGIANLFKFKEFIDESDVVIDFGCGGGYLLQNISCRRKIGIEINESARQVAISNEIEAFPNIEDITDNVADVIISNHALEHIRNPFDILKLLFNKVKNGGKIIFVVPHQDTREEYSKDDINKHLYTWNQLTLGNLFAEAGFEVLKVEALQHQWPPNYLEIYALYGEEEFHRQCCDYARSTNNYQIRIISTKS